MLNVGINGFGRIGRAIFRQNYQNSNFNVVAINDINPSIENLSYMLKYDSTYGIFNHNIESKNSSIIIDNKDEIEIFHQSKISDAPWSDYNIDIIIDSSGIYDNLLYAKELRKQGIKKQLVTNTPESTEIDQYIIFGVNENLLVNEENFLISCSICDASAVAPVLNILDNKYGVEHGFLTTLHPWLSYQNLLDGPSRSFAYPGTIIDNFSLGRASLNALIPKTTSAIKASEKVLNDLKGKFQSLSYRVPTSIVSSADLTIKLNDVLSKNDVIEVFKDFSLNQNYKIISNNFDPLISTDFIGSEYSAIIDHRWTQINESNYLKLILWYDNEWGYSSRIIDAVKLLSQDY